MTESCSAIILAGGESRRMGRPKAWLDFHGRPLLAHMVELLSPRFDEILVVAAPGQELPESSARIVRDEEPGKGPVGGLVAGLRQCGNPLAFVTAVDIPHLQTEIVDVLLTRIGGADVAIPRWEETLQPLCALYRITSVLPALEHQLRNDKLRLKDLFATVRTCIVSAPELERSDPQGLSFLSMNAPCEYALAMALPGADTAGEIASRVTQR